MKSILTVESARDLGPQFTDNSHKMVGQDGAYSFPVADKTLFYFGDTLIGARVPGESIWYPGGIRLGKEDMTGKCLIEFMPNNCALLLKDKTGKGGLNDFRYICDDKGQIKQLVPRTPNEHRDEVRIWCLHGAYINEKVYLFYIRVNMLADGPLPVNFELAGSGLAVGSTDDWNFERIEHNGTTLIWNAKQPQFASAVLHNSKEKIVYLYGANSYKTGVQSAYLARVGSDDIENIDKYEYLSSQPPQFSKPMWSEDAGDCIPLFEHMPNEMSVSYNEYLNCYLAVHNYETTGGIVGRTAPAPWGPWSDPVTLWTVEPHYEKPIPYTPLIYAGKEHPTLSENNGKTIYITYIEFEEYYPHLLEITLGELK